MITTGREMPKYKCHKEVWALKIKSIVFHPDLGDATIFPEDENYNSFTVDPEYVNKHKPKEGGYYVVYKGGYQSWSPAIEFEEGYVKI
jgi:hypothetical protein